MIREVRERVDYKGRVFLRLDEDDVRLHIRDLVDAGAEALVVLFTNSVVNPDHELRVREIFLEEYPGHLLGAMPMLLSHQVAGRKGEYARGMSTILDAFLHATMYHGLGTLELNLRANGYDKPMLVNHNSGGMAQLNSTDALQTVHSGPVSGIAASEHLMNETGLGNIVATDMGGTSFDIGIVVEGGVKYYDFNPVIDRWLVSIPMVHLVTLGAGGGSICSYDRMFRTVKIGPASAGSDPGPACYDRGGLSATVTDADLLLGYLDPTNYAGGHIKINPRRAKQAIEDTLCDDLDLDTVEVAKLIKRSVDGNMANGIATELRTRGYEPKDFTLPAYGGNGPLHACGIANALGIDRVLAPPYSSVFSAVGAGNVNQMHIHEANTWTVLFNANTKSFFADYAGFNDQVEELERRGREDLLRQGFEQADITYRLELDMRYGNQRVETAVVTDLRRLHRQGDVLRLIEEFRVRYGARFGEGSQSPEAGIRVNTIRVCSYVEQAKVTFARIGQGGATRPAPAPVSTRPCHFVGHAKPLETRIYDEAALAEGTSLAGPAIVASRATTYLVEPGWQLYVAAQGAVWFLPQRALIARKEEDAMNTSIEETEVTREEAAVRDRFLAENRLFLGPDPEIMRNHSLAPRTADEERILSRGVDAHQVHQIRGLVNAALTESFQMVNQMGAAPGAKWGDLVTGVFTKSGDLAMISPHGIIGFAICCFYPIKFITKYWMDDPTVGVKEGDGFIHNDARYAAFTTPTSR